MKIDAVKLQDYRAFEDSTFSFDRNLNVLVGVNGSGKSSILEAIAVALSRLFVRVRRTKGTGRLLKVSDVRHGASEARCTIKVMYENDEFVWQIIKGKKPRYNKSKKSQSIRRLKTVKMLANIIGTELVLDEEANIPLAVYYPVNRAILDVPLRIKKRHSFEQLSSYDKALSGARSDFRLFFEWYRNQEDLENEQRLRPVEHVDRRRSDEYRDPMLQAVREAVHSIAGFSNVRIRRNPLRMEVQKGNQLLDVRQLSDGEKCLLAMAGDLARRLAIANPSLGNPLDGEAVVLIDEIELHLHPEWQHKVVKRLRETFPNSQFILTTHSPQVVSHVPCKNIWCLVDSEDGVEVNRPDGTYGQDSNFLLKTLFRSSYRPSEVEQSFQRLYCLIDEDPKEARQLLNSLVNEIEGNSPELVRAEVMLHRKESKAK